MVNFFTYRAYLSFLLIAFLLAPDTTRAESVSDMLERTLHAVVTVALYESEQIPRPFGFAGTQGNIAYGKALDLTGVESTGSGFVIEHQGKKYVVTNAHVIQRAKDSPFAISSLSVNRTKYAMKIVGADSFYDIAVLEFADKAPGAEIRTVTFRNREPRIGEPIYAVGNPGSEYPYTVTNGIISGKNRMFDTLTSRYGYLQTSATTFHGNSGGPVVDQSGHVVGVVTRKGMINGIWQPQMNFSLEAKIAERVVQDILTNNGRVRRAFTGLVLQQTHRIMCLPSQECLLMNTTAPPALLAVLPNSPTQGLGKFVGAQLKQINDVAVQSLDDALGAFEAVRPKSDVKLLFRSDGKDLVATIRAAELTTDQLENIATHVLSLKQESISVDLQNDRLVLQKVSSAEMEESVLEDPSKDADNVTSKESSQSGGNSATQVSMTNQIQLLPILAAGVVNEEGENNVWTVSTLAELGVVIRISAMEGQIALVCGNDAGQLVVERWNLAGSERNTLRRLLLY